MGQASETQLLTLHGLRLRGFSEPDGVAEVVGLDPEVVKPILDQFVHEEFAIYREGRMSGYTLTAAGRARHEHLLADELDAAGCRDEVQDAYTRFLALNRDLLEICTAWQMRDVDGTPTPNDHSDPSYDQKVIGDLVALNDKVRPICADLRSALERFGGYGGRLREALERLLAGELEYFTKPLIPSYHTVWFEMHEDLLATLGIDRASEENHR